MSIQLPMHHTDTNNVHGEKPWWELHKNAACYIEQILEATLHERKVVRPLTPISKSIQVKPTWPAGHTTGETRTNLQVSFSSSQECTYNSSVTTGCNLEDLLGAIDDRDGCREKVREIYASSAMLTYIYIYIYIEREREREGRRRKKTYVYTTYYSNISKRLGLLTFTPAIIHHILQRILRIYKSFSLSTHS